jgi:hypothetical protein
MNLTSKLYEALKSEDKGFAMVRVLEAAKARGVTRIEAEQAVLDLLNQIPGEPSRSGITSDADLTIEILMITQINCQVRYRIWPE